jgi:hypothetical protein
MGTGQTFSQLPLIQIGPSPVSSKSFPGFLSHPGWEGEKWDGTETVPPGAEEGNFESQPGEVIRH